MHRKNAPRRQLLGRILAGLLGCLCLGKGQSAAQAPLPVLPTPHPPTPRILATVSEYDNQGNLLRVEVRPEQPVSTPLYSYDRHGRLTTSTDA